MSSSQSSSQFHPPSFSVVKKCVPQARSMSIQPRRSSTTTTYNRFHTWPPTNSFLAVTTTTTAFSSKRTVPNDAEDDDEEENRYLWWDWKENRVTLATLPPFYVLDRSSMVVQQPLEQLLERIDNFLRLKSIASVFHAKEARLDCRISGGVTNFAIYLWRSNDFDEGGIIVEVQRRSGCCILMHHIQKALFHYIMTGEEEATTSAAASSLASPSCMTSSGSFHGDMAREVCSKIKQQEKQQHQQHVSEEKQCKDNMDICQDLLESDWEDHKRLGMESLVLMTNPYVSCEKLANAVSRSLIYGNDGSGNALRAELVKSLDHNERPTDSQAKVRKSITDSDNEELEYAQGREFGVLHNLSLHVLVNALEVVTSSKSHDKKDGSAHVDLTSDFWQTITKALVYNLDVAIHRPDEASLSARCLTLLQDIVPPSSSGSILTMLRKHDQFLRKLFRAQDYGRAHHLRLEQESRNLLGRLTAAHS